MMYATAFVNIPPEFTGWDIGVEKISIYSMVALTLA
jgi:hypothetical protein